MRAIWKGAISFGLVSIPIVLFSATKDTGVAFKMLHSTCKTPLRYKRWCETDEIEVPWKEVARGLEIADDTFFVLTKEELAKIRPAKTTTIDLKGFVDPKKVDSLYLEKHYFVGPQNEKDKAFFLFRDAIGEVGKVAVGSFVMHENEHLCMIQRYKEGLLLTTLKYGDEVRDIEKVEGLKTKVKVTDAEMQLAKELIGKLVMKDFDIKQYQETFVADLRALIKKKLAGEKITVEKKPKMKAEESLIKALKASIK